MNYTSPVNVCHKWTAVVFITTCGSQHVYHLASVVIGPSAESNPRSFKHEAITLPTMPQWQRLSNGFRILMFGIRAPTVLWGSEIQPSMDFKMFKRGWAANGLDLEWDLLLEAQPFFQKPFEI